MSVGVGSEFEFFLKNFLVDLGQAAAHVVGFDAVAEAGPSGREFLQDSADLAGL